MRVNLLGRYMLADRREFPCQVVDMSPGDVRVEAPVTGKPGQRVVAYIDHLGRVEGTISRVSATGFAMSISATARKRDKIAAQLTWLANRQILGLAEDRDYERSTPRNDRSIVKMPNGISVTCRIIDLSLSGAAIATDKVPPIGALITLGKVPARVVRHVDGGFAVEFTRLQHPDSLEENVSAA